MNVRTIPSYLILIGVAAMVLAATPATAGTAGWQSYAAKFVCGAASMDTNILQGKYRTNVNIHNPHFLQDVTGAPIPLTFFKKVVLAKPQGEEPLPPSCHQLEALRTDEALAVNCTNIKTLLGLSGLPTAGNLEGFVVIEVPPQGIQGTTPPLDVVALYFARPRTGTSSDVRIYDVRAIEVERVPPTTIIGDPVQDPCI